MATEVVGRFSTERRRLHELAFAPIDPASLVAFRVGFGLLMFAAVVRFVAHGWVHEHFVAPTFFFEYWGFEWVRPWPGAWMYVHFAAMGLAALGIAAGAYYRLSAATFCVLFTYAHLIDKTHYLNHYYLVSLLSLLMAFMPLGRVASLDAWRRGDRVATVPAWVLWTLRFQVGVVYVFGGIAKLSDDWLVHAQPMTIWLAASTDFPVVGHLLSQKWLAQAASWAGAAFDLSIVPLLAWRRTRPFAYAALLVFHVVTARLFQLGMFPWIMSFCALVFFSPSWPRAWLGRRWPATAPTGAPEQTPMPSRRRADLVLAGLALHAILQIAVPLRGHLYPNRATWSEEGFRFSWRVMIVEKNGVVDFVATEPSTGRRWFVSPSEMLTPYQVKMMSTQPDMILQLARHVADRLEHRGVKDVQVRADAHVSLNGRRSQRLVDPEVDLAREHDGFAAKRWILPLSASEPEL